VLGRFSLSQEEYDEHVRQRLQRRRPQTITPQFVEISGTTPSTAAEISATFGIDTKGKPLDRKTLEADLDRVTGYGPYSSADYGFTKKDGADGFDLRIHQKQHAPPTLNLLLLLDGASGEGLRFGAGGRVTFLDVPKPRAEWRTDFNIGRINEIATEYYLSLGRSRIFVAPRAGYAKGEIPFYSGEDQIATVDTDNTVAGVDVGFAQSRFNEGGSATTTREAALRFPTALPFSPVWMDASAASGSATPSIAWTAPLPDVTSSNVEVSLFTIFDLSSSRREA
jgi:hypothetical protein